MSEPIAPLNFDAENDSRSFIEAVKLIKSPVDWTRMSPQFYSTFWSLTLYDIYVPKER